MAVAIAENYPDALEPGLFEFASREYDQLEPLAPMLYSTRESGTSFEKASGSGAIGDFQPRTGAVSYGEFFQKEAVRWDPVPFDLGIKIERELWDDDLYGGISEKPGELADSAMRTRENWGAHVFNTAFSGSGSITVLNNSEGQALCSTAHSSGSSALSTTYSNTGTLALSPTAVNTTRKNMRKFVGDRAEHIHVRPSLILCAPQKEDVAFEIIATSGQVDSANNNANFHFGRYKLAVWDYLTSDTAWYLIDDVLMRKWLKWFDRIPLEFGQAKDFDSFVAKFIGYMRFSFGWKDWRFVHGQNATS